MIKVKNYLELVVDFEKPVEELVSMLILYLQRIPNIDGETERKVLHDFKFEVQKLCERNPLPTEEAENEERG